MRTLDRKLLRNLLSLRGQVAAIVLIIGCGVASYVTMFTAYRGLVESREAYYLRYRMADVFASVERAPRRVVRELERVPGVRRVEGRIVFDVTLDLPTLAEPGSGRIVSAPDRRQPHLCDLHLTAGSWFSGDGTREVIVAARFARVHGLAVGDTLSVLMNNRKEALRIVATALSPEYVYMIRGAGDLLPDPERFTILWLSHSFAEAVFGYDEAINDVVATIDRDANPEAIVQAFDIALDRYGGPGAYGREDQISNRLLHEEIKGLKTTVTMVPAVFLGIAAFILHVLMGRLVAAQRAQVALMRAFGYTRAAVALHFLKFAAIVGVLGALVGTVGGLLMARGMLRMYQQFFEFPVLTLTPDPLAIAAGAATSVVFACLGTAHAVWTVSRLDPAEGMRPPAPATYGETLLERFRALWASLGFAPRMVLRHVARNRLRSAITALGVSLATAITLFAFFAFGAWAQILDVQYRLVERHDASVQFHRKRGLDALREVRQADGVLLAEPELLIGVELVNGRKVHKTALRGLAPDGELRALIDSRLQRTQLPDEGIVLARGLAKVLGVRAGDALEVRVLEGREPTLQLPVAKVVDEYLGANAYVEIGTLSRLMGEEFALSGVLIRVDPQRREQLGRTLKDLPSVSAVNFKDNTLRMLRETIQGSQQVANVVILGFAGIMAFGVLYNTARISLAQRGRELASLRILGFSHREVGAVLAGEGMLLTVLGIVPGLGLGALLAYAMSQAHQNELYSFPFVLPASSLLASAAVILAFALVANALVLRQLRELDLIEVLKTRE